MVKLIRLTSNNNAHFKANLDDGIQIDEDSQIAVKNLTFNAEFNSLEIKTSNKNVTYSLNPDLYTTGNAELSQRIYNSATNDEFYPDLNGALNGTLAINAVAAVGDNTVGTYSSFDVRHEKQEIAAIYFKYNMPIMMFNMNGKLLPGGTVERGGKRVGIESFMLVNEDVDGIENLTINDTTPANQPNPAQTAINNLGNMTSVAGKTNTDLFNRWVGTDRPWSRGSAFFSCRVQNLVNHGGTDDRHGFAIGLSYTNLIEDLEPGSDTALRNIDRDFEICVEKNNTTYKFISPTSKNTLTPAVPALLPYLYDITTTPDPREHDILVLERKNNVITGCVWSTSDVGGLRTELFSYNIPNSDRDKNLYPYIYMKGDSTVAEAGYPVITMDGLRMPNNTKNQVTGETPLAGQRNPIENQTVSFYDDIAPTFSDVFWLAGGGGGGLDNTNASITLNGDVWRFLGYDPEKYPADIPYTLSNPETYIEPVDGGEEWSGFVARGEDLNQLINSDNFVVVLDSANVFSYDASKTDYGTAGIDNPKIANRGRRLNIIATIPKNDNVGYLEYEPNEITYIDLDNSISKVIKNIEVRVLDKEFNKIDTFGTSILTLLIK